MKKKMVLIMLIILLVSLISPKSADAQDEVTTNGAELDASDLDFGLISENELWLKSGSKLFYTSNSGMEWSEISPDTSLVEPYLVVSFPASDLGFALYLTQTETTIDLEIYKTSSQGSEWTQIAGNLEEKIDQFDHPAGNIWMQWLDENDAMVLVQAYTSSNFSMGTLFVTSDGGMNWSEKTVPVAEDFTFLDRDLGFMLNPANATSLYETIDGGNNWSLLELGSDEILAYGLAKIDLPIQNYEGKIYVPVKTIEEDSEGIDILVGINPRTTQKSPGNMEILEAIPIIVQDNQKQMSVETSSQIDQIQITGNDNLWVSLAGGKCQSFPTDEGGVEFTCQSTWQMLKSSNKGSNWSDMILPNGLTNVNYQVITQVGSLQVDPDEKSPSNQLQAGEWVKNFKGHAFDKCEIPTLSQLQSWYNNGPYRAVNLYIGGISRFCSNKPLSASYIQSIYRQGWKLIPTWVGHQAPCTKFKYPFSYNVNEAYQTGVDNANQASARLKEYNLSNADGSGSIIYLDLEHFAYTASCSAAARAYVNGWTTRLAQLGIRSGLYSTSSGIEANEFYNLSTPINAAWIAEWYTTPKFRPDETVWNLLHLSNEYWTSNQRIVQYSGGHFETWGGVSLEIDSNVADGKVAVPFGADLVPPVTTVKFSGTLGYDGWYKTPVQVTLSATDNTVGVRYTYYKIDNGIWTLYTGPFSVSGGSIKTLRYLSVDMVDNWEGPKVTQIKVDTVPPSLGDLINVGCKAYNNIPQPWCNNAYFVWNPATDLGTGIPSSLAYQYYWGTNPQGTSGNYTDGRWFDPGAIPMKTPHYLRLRAQDNNGNWSAWKTMFTLIYDPTAKPPIWLPIMFKR